MQAATDGGAMVTSRQFTRGVVRTMRAMDRAAKQAERQRIARQQALHRQAQLDASAQAAAEYDAIMDALTGAHRIQFRRRDWLTVATEPTTPDPERTAHEQAAAEAELDNYAPGWFARTFGREAHQRQALADRVDAARARDDESHLRRKQAVSARNAEIEFARRVVAREPDALAQALEDHSGIGSLPFSVEGANLVFRDDRIIAVVDGLDLDDMPEESVSLLKSGKASVKTIPVGKRLEVHRDALCSAAVRVGLECLATLPIDEVELVMLTDVLDRGTGHITAAPALHLRLTAQAVAALNLTRTDAAELVDRLGAHIDWNRRDGFRPINAAAFGIDL